MSKMERQKYIDEILQLSKYELVWENMREAIRDLERDAKEIEGELKEEPFLREEMKRAEEEKEKLKGELTELEEKEGEKKERYSKVSEKFGKVREELERLEERRRKYENAKSLVEEKERELKHLEEETSALRREIEEIKVGEIDYDEVLREYTSLKEKVNGYEERLRELEKEYEGVIELGKTTETDDREGKILQQQDVPSFYIKDIQSVLKKFVGEIEQVPPMYSALKKHGVRLYKLARKGKVVYREPRKVKIHEIRVKCSRGTYVRALARDIGKELGVGGYLKELCRTRIGTYSIKDSYTLTTFRELLVSKT